MSKPAGGRFQSLLLFTLLRLFFFAAPLTAILLTLPSEAKNGVTLPVFVGIALSALFSLALSALFLQPLKEKAFASRNKRPTVENIDNLAEDAHIDQLDSEQNPHNISAEESEIREER